MEKAEAGRGHDSSCGPAEHTTVRGAKKSGAAQARPVTHVGLALLRLLLQHAQARLCRRQQLAELLGLGGRSGAARARLLQLAAQHVGLRARDAAVALRRLEAVGAALLLARRLLLRARQLGLQRRGARGGAGGLARVLLLARGIGAPRGEQLRLGALALRGCGARSLGGGGLRRARVRQLRLELRRAARLLARLLAAAGRGRAQLAKLALEALGERAVLAELRREPLRARLRALQLPLPVCVGVGEHAVLRARSCGVAAGSGFRGTRRVELLPQQAGGLGGVRAELRDRRLELRDAAPRRLQLRGGLGAGAAGVAAARRAVLARLALAQRLVRGALARRRLCGEGVAHLHLRMMDCSAGRGVGGRGGV